MSATPSPITRLPLDSITLDDACQPRAITDFNLAGEYAEAMLVDGAVFPPVVVFHDGGTYWLADGYHRWHAASIAHLPNIDCDVRQGGRRDAILHGIGANAEHGWRRSNDDKRKAVLTLLADPEWAAWSDREISRRCGVDNTMVSRMRPKLSVVEQQIDPKRKVERGGTVYEQNTAGINAGRSTCPAPTQAAPEPEFKYDMAAGLLRQHMAGAIETINGFPPPEDVMQAWMAGYQPSLPPDHPQRAADWLMEFAKLYQRLEPQRRVAVEAALERARNLNNGTH